MANLIESVKGSVHTFVNFLPNKTSSHDHHVVPVTVHGNPALTHQPLYCPFQSATSGFLNSTITKEIISHWNLQGQWNADIDVPAYLFYPSTMVATANLTLGRTWTTPSAASLVSYIVQQGEPFRGNTYWEIKLGARNFNLTLAAGAGVAFDGSADNPVIAAGTHRTIGIRLTDLNPGAEQYILYIL